MISVQNAFKKLHGANCPSATGAITSNKAKLFTQKIYKP